MKRTKTNILDLLHLHFIVVILGFTGILGKLITLPAFEMVIIRMLIAAAGLALWLVLNRNLKITQPRKIVSYILTGFVVAAHWVAFFGSIKVANVSVALACFASTALFTSLLEPLFFKVRISITELFLGILTIVGIALIFRFEPKYTTGIFYGIIAAVTGALFMVFNKQFQQDERAEVVSMFEMLGGVVGLLIFATYHVNVNGYELNFALKGNDLLWLILLGLVCTSYAFMASVKVMRSLSAYHVVLTINLEPVYGILLAVLIFGETERMTPQFYMGAGILIVTVLAYSFIKKRLRI